MLNKLMHWMQAHQVLPRISDAERQALEAGDVWIDGEFFAGAGVMQGPNNIIGRGYCAAPVGVTVEGANIMTRTLIVFGQGAVRCHPYALDLVKVVEAGDTSAFRRHLTGWVRHFFGATACALSCTV